MRSILLKVHLWLGIAAAIFLLILSLTGTVMAFEHDIDYWLHPGLWYVTPGARILPEKDLVLAIEQRLHGPRVAVAQIPEQPNLAHQMRLTDRSVVYVNPYDASIRGRVWGVTKTERILAYIHQLHLRLLPDPRSSPRAYSEIGKLVVSFAGLTLCLLVPTGLMLWWRSKRTSINWKASWFRIVFDTHHVVGAWAALFLFVAGLTGVMVGFDFAESLLYTVSNSSPPTRFTPPQSTVVPGATPIGVDTALEQARLAIPGGVISGIQFPTNSKAPFTIQVRSPLDPSVPGAALAAVFIDQYSGKTLAIRDSVGTSPGYRLVRWNRAIHTGDFGGTMGHLVTSLSSLLLGVMVLTGLVIWLKKLAV